jgi:hypothetical protein
MAGQAAMPSSRDTESLRTLQTELESFLESLRHPIVGEDGVELIDLTSAEWRLTIEYGKLIFTAWNAARSVSRRLEEVAYRDRGRIGIFAWKSGARESRMLEFRELLSSEQGERKLERGAFRKQLLAMLGREYRGWSFERVSNRSDREHSFSAWYTRGVARQGRTAWAFLGLGETESAAAVDAVLAFGLIWLDWLRSRSERVVVPGLKLLLPSSAIDLIAHRAAFLNQRAVQLEILAWWPGQDHPAPVDLRDFGNVETRLVPRRQGLALAERHRALLGDLLGDLRERIDVLPDPTGTFLSLRVLGLEVGRVEGQLAPRVYFGLEGSVRKLEEGGEPGRAGREEFRRFLLRVLEARRADASGPSQDFYRLQAERWLESLLVRDVPRLDPVLLPTSVYPQVPAFTGMDRGVIDILAATRSGRLAVLELKLHEEINLPLQALDYWLRVKWLQERGQFHAMGYFPDLELAKTPPLLYLISPAFRFHSTTPVLLRYVDPQVRVIQIGLNDSWREDVKVLFRHEVAAA